MPAPIFIGDEVSAIGYRLAGARVRTPPVDEFELELHRAAQSAELIIVTQHFLGTLSRERQLEWLTKTKPVLVAVPDVRSEISVNEMADHLRRQLGMLG